MANTVSILSYANTFGELVTTLNSLSRENNDVAANNYTKPTGTLFLNDTNLGLQVANNAIIQGGLQVQGVGSSAYVQNNLRVDGQVYLTNTTLSLTTSGQANIGGPLYALSSANSIIASNNVTIGGNTYVTGNIFSSNNLVVAGNTRIVGSTLINGATNVANFLTVTQNVSVIGATYTDRLIANTSTRTLTSYVTNLLDAGTAYSQLNIVTANNFTTSRGYIDTLQSNTLISATEVDTGFLSASSLRTPTANVITLFDANNASGFIKNLQVQGQLSIAGNFVINGSTVYNSNTFTLNSGSTSGQISSFIVNRGTSGANSAIRWNEPLSYWDLNDVTTGTYYRLLTTQQTVDNLTSTSNTLPASANTVRTLSNNLTSANSYLQAAVASAGSYGNSAFLQANAAFIAANNVGPQIQPTFNQANSAYAQANTAANTFIGTSGQITPTNGSITITSNNGVQIIGGGNTFYINTPQSLKVTDGPTFAGLTLSSPLQLTQGGTGSTSAAGALTALLPTAVGVPAGYVLATGGVGSYYWAAGGTGGGGGATPGTTINSSRTFSTSNTNQTVYTVPTYIPGASQLRMFADGVRQYNSDYTETSNNTITLNTPLPQGTSVMFEVDGYINNPYYANNITFTAPFGGITSSANTIQLAIQDIETRKATLASPTFTGIPTSTTAPTTTSNTWIATTAFVSAFANASYTFTASITGNAGTVTNGVYTNNVYSDPSWITISKAKVGLGNVDNTADANKSVNYAVSAGSATTATTASLSNSLNTGNNYQINALWVGSGTPSYAGNEIKAVGNITAYVSDERLKNKLGKIENALDKVDQLTGFYYELNNVAKELGLESSGREVGVSAQQVQLVQPEAVAPAPVDENYLTVRYERLIPLLIEAIKELRTEVNEIKGQIK